MPTGLCILGSRPTARTAGSDPVNLGSNPSFPDYHRLPMVFNEGVVEMGGSVYVEKSETETSSTDTTPTEAPVGTVTTTPEVPVASTQVETLPQEQQDNDPYPAQ